jgi:hypothetical protein
LYVPRKQGGRGLIQLQEAFIIQTMKLMEYVENKADSLIKITGTHQHKTNLAVLQNAKNIKEKCKKGTRQIKDIVTGMLKERWQGNRLHGQFPRS